LRFRQPQAPPPSARSETLAALPLRIAVPSATSNWLAKGAVSGTKVAGMAALAPIAKVDEQGVSFDRLVEILKPYPSVKDKIGLPEMVKALGVVPTYSTPNGNGVGVMFKRHSLRSRQGDSSMSDLGKTKAPASHRSG